MKDKSIGDRIKERREYLGLTQNDIAVQMGYASTNISAMISKWETGQRNPSTKTLKQLAHILQCSFQYLKYGEEQEDVVNRLYQHAETPAGYIRLREISHVAAGQFATLLTIDDEVITYPVPIEFLSGVNNLTPDEIQKRFFVFSVFGDSMSPDIKNGDKIVVKRVSTWQEIKKSDIVIVVNEENEIIVKRVKKTNGVYVLESVNPDKSLYPDIEIKPDVTVAGKVVYRMGSV